MMTEKEAIQRWCPHVRYGNAEGCNRNWTPEGAGMMVCCIASGCMAWRWEMVPNPEPFDGPLNVQGDKGYCGLAGRPE